MEQFEEIIKLALKEDLKGKSLEKSPSCPGEFELADFIGGHLPKKRKNELNSHLNNCPACVEDLLLANKIMESEMKKTKKGTVFTKWLKKKSWLILAISSFVLSFIYSQYFLQLLVATLVLAAKWIFETVNARTLIMIYDAWDKGGEREVGKVLKRFNSRIS